jgi:RimJ/RimL family protein N-acetyltransferase
MRTARLRLRPLAAADLDALVALDADPEVMRHVTDGRPTPRWLYEEALLPRMLGAATADRPGFLVAEDPEGAFLGWFHLRADRFEPAWAELGWRLRRAVWGRGLATEGAAALAAWARARDPLVVLSARTVPENRASVRVMEKVGLGFAGAFVFPAGGDPRFPMPAATGVLYRSPADHAG